MIIEETCEAFSIYLVISQHDASNHGYLLALHLSEALKEQDNLQKKNESQHWILTKLFIFAAW